MLAPKSEVEVQRDLEIVREPSKFMNLIRKHFVASKLMLNGFEPPPEIKIIELREPSHIVVDFQGFQVSVGQTYKIYTVIARYAHICARMVQDKVAGGRYGLLVLEYLAIARQNRDAVRIPIIDNSVFISNFRVSRNEINLNMQRIPTSVKLGFTELRNTLIGRADHVEVEVYEAGGTVRGSLPIEVCESAKPLLISNTLDAESYKPFNRSYFDAAAYFKKYLERQIAEFRKKGIVSEICIPVIYLVGGQTVLPLGYILMQSRTKHFLPEDVQEIWHIAKNTIERIRSSNTLLISERESVTDISRGGLMVHVKNPVLIEHLYKKNPLTFDLFFRMQAPTTLYGAIRSIMELDVGIKLGIQILGNSSRPKEMERFNENIEILEKKYLATHPPKKESKVQRK